MLVRGLALLGSLDQNGQMGGKQALRLRSEGFREIEGAPVQTVLSPKTHDLGGFVVRRALPSVRLRSVGPFVFADHMGPSEPRPHFQVPPHPHIGISTLTYFFEGRGRHLDSLGTDQEIFAGDVNWMTAGRGIVHAEQAAPGYEGGFHGMQFWVALPANHEEDEPSFQHLSSGELPAIVEAGTGLTLVAGRGFGLVSPLRVQGSMFLASVRMVSGASLKVPAEHQERAFYLMTGTLRLGSHTFAAPALLSFTAGLEGCLEAEEPVLGMFFGGEPLGERRYMDWNFVSTSRERIERAREEYRSGKLGSLPEVGENLPHPADVG